MTKMESWRSDFDDRYPIYIQIVDKFSKAIVKGDMEQGERIPSIRDMAVILKVNTNTIQRAYSEMENDGIIYSQRGMGYFVREDEELVDGIKKEMVENATEKFLKDMRELGFTGKDILEEVKQRIEGDENNENDDNK